MSQTLGKLTLTGAGLFLTNTSIINNRGLPLSFPETGSGNVISTDVAATITNKIVNDTTNTVGANIIRATDGSWTAIVSGAAPIVGQVLAYNGSGHLTFVSNGGLTGVAATTTDSATAVQLYTVTPANQTGTNLIVDVVGYDSTAPANTSSFRLQGSFVTDNTPTTTAVGSGTNLLYFGPTVGTIPTIAFDLTASPAIRVLLTGITGETIKWSGTATLVSAGP